MYDEQKHCCTICDSKRKCHVCGTQTNLACSDCAIDLGVTVYVCSKTECRDQHERKCGHALRAELDLLRKRKDYHAEYMEVTAELEQVRRKVGEWETAADTLRRNCEEQVARAEAAESREKRLKEALEGILRIIASKTEVRDSTKLYAVSETARRAL